MGRTRGLMVQYDGVHNMSALTLMKELQRLISRGEAR
jgi:hypothetical protein